MSKTDIAQINSENNLENNSNSENNSQKQTPIENKSESQNSETKNSKSQILDSLKSDSLTPESRNLEKSETGKIINLEDLQILTNAENSKDQNLQKPDSFQSSVKNINLEPKIESKGETKDSKIEIAKENSKENLEIDFENLRQKFSFLRIFCLVLVLIIGILVGFGQRTENLFGRSSANFGVLEKQTRSLIEKEFLFDKPSDKDLDFGKLKGLVATLNDPYSEFLTVEDSKKAENRLNNRYVGIGIQFDFKNGVRVQKILKNSPASRSDLQVGDELISVNDEKISQIKITELADKIRGEAGTTVKLEIKRNINLNDNSPNQFSQNSLLPPNQNSNSPKQNNSSSINPNLASQKLSETTNMTSSDQKPKENSVSNNFFTSSALGSANFYSKNENSAINQQNNAAQSQILSLEIKREQIIGEIVELEVRGATGIITISSFGDNLDAKMKQIAQQIVANSQIQDLIIDLRGNGGGLLDQTVAVSSYFLAPNSLIVQEKSKKETQKLNSVPKSPSLSNYPLRVLIDGNSASASEIMAAALRDNRQIPLIGQKSFGKGIVQRVFDLGGGNKVKLTIEKWLTPKDFEIHKVGLTPDQIVPENEDILEFALKKPQK